MGLHLSSFNRKAGLLFSVFSIFCFFYTVTGFSKDRYVDSDKLTKQKIKLDISDEDLKKLSPEVKEKIIPWIEQYMEKYVSIPDELPDLTFDPAEDTQIIETTDLFKQPTDDEISRLPVVGHRLDDEQLKSVWDTAEFVIPSVDYPGQYHVWRIKAYILKGQKEIRVTLGKHMANARRHIAISFPETFLSNDSNAYSFRRALHNLYHGLKAAASLLVGVAEEGPKYFPDQVEKLINSEIRKHVVEKNSKGTDGKPSLDLRLYDNELMEKALPILSRIESEKLGDRFDQDKYYEEILNSKELEELSSGLGLLLVNHGRMLEVVYEKERALAAKNEQFLKTKTQELTEKYQFSEDEAFKRARVLASKKYQSQKYETYMEVIAELNEMGLTQEAILVSDEVAYLKDNEQKLKIKIESEKNPNKGWEWNYNYWLPSQYKVVPFDKDEPSYGSELKKYRVVEVNTSRFGWRLWNWAVHTGYVWNNGLQWLIMQNFWSGPLGLKSLFEKEAFAYDWTVSESNEKVLDTQNLRGTLRSRIRAVLDLRQNEWQKFKDDDGGGLPNWVKRIGVHAKADLVYGFIYPTGLILGQPTLTALNAVLSTAAVATSVVWAPLYSTLAWGLHAAIYDPLGTAYGYPTAKDERMPMRVLPLVSALVYRGVGTVAQTGASLFKALFHPLSSLAHVVVGAARTGLRQAWDHVTYPLIVKRIKVPRRSETFGMERVAGPGSSAKFFYQVDPNLGALMVQASAEKAELDAFRSEAKGVLDQPARRFQSNIGSAMELLLGASASPASLALKEMEEARQKGHKFLDNELDAYTRLYDRLLTVPIDRVLDNSFEGREIEVRATKENLELMLKQGAALLESYYSKTQPSWSSKAIDAFWLGYSLKKGDWVGLAKWHYSKVFGSGFLKPLEETDKTLRVEVEHARLDDLIGDVIKGVPTKSEDLERYKVTLEEESVEELEGPRQPRSSDICNTQLVREVIK
ncbi:MAG: hypothetical protein AB7F43_00035 [Bacteriovoracia bacterium]